MDLKTPVRTYVRKYLTSVPIVLAFIVSAHAEDFKLDDNQLALGASGITFGPPPSIIRWDNNQPIPGTTGIVLGSGVDLSNWNAPGHQLEYAELSVSVSLASANFTNSDLQHADWGVANLSGANFTDADLDFAYFSAANQGAFAGTLTNAIFTNASIAGADFSYNRNNFHSLTPIQLYSTASYANKNLAGIKFYFDNLDGWNFSSQNLTGANFGNSSLVNDNLGSANLTNSNFADSTFCDSTAGLIKSFPSLPSASLAGANVTGANFANATLHTNPNNEGISGANFSAVLGFTPAQLYSTASYINKKLVGINFGYDNLSAWNFANQDLSSASFGYSYLTGANFTNSKISQTSFNSADLRGAIGWGPGNNNIDTILPDGSVEGLSWIALLLPPIRNYPLQITVHSHANFDPAWTLQFQLDDSGASWGSTIGFDSGLTPSLAGTLDLEFNPTIDPATLLGDSFQLFAFNAPLDASNHFTAITADPRATFDLSNLYTTGTVTLIAVAAPEPASLVLLGLSTLLLLIRRRPKFRQTTNN